MAELMVCLTFDHDSTAATIAREEVSASALSGGEFAITGAARVLALLAGQRLPSTWFITGHTIESYPDSAAAVHAAGHEIAHHGWTHRPPTGLGPGGEQAELESGMLAIETLTSRRPSGYRAPTLELSPHSIGLLIDAGFTYDSSMAGQDYIPYQARVGDRAALLEPMEFGPDTPLVEMPVHWSLDDAPYFEYRPGAGGAVPMSARAALENWIDEFRYMKRHCDWGVLTYTFHPHIIGRGHRMAALEHLVEVLHAEGATFLTMADAVSEYQRRFPGGVSLRGG